MVQTLEYYLYGETPVMYIPRKNGDLAVKALDIDNQRFYGDSSFYVDILYDRDGIVKKLTEQEFLLEVLKYGMDELAVRTAQQ